jgi:hypothetical protein
MDKQKLQQLIQDWLQSHDELERYNILQQASIPRKGKKWTDAIQYYVRSKTVHNPRKAEIQEACQQILKEVTR